MRYLRHPKSFTVALLNLLLLPALAASQETSSVRARLSGIEPAEELRQAVQRFQAADADATFTWFRGHVDSFSTRPRPTVPPYAGAVLKRFGLPTAARQPVLVPVTEEPKPALNLEKDHSVPFPYPGEIDVQPKGSSKHPDDTDFDGSSQEGFVDNRPPPSPGPAVAAVNPRERRAAKRILAGFLARHRNVFEVPVAEAEGDPLPGLELVRYGVGRHARRAVYRQRVGELPILRGKTIVLYDLNWNVVAISRQLATGAKLDLAAGKKLPETKIRSSAIEAVSKRSGEPSSALEVVRAVRGIDVVRGIIAWEVRVVEPQAGRYDFIATIDAASGEILNLYDNIDRYSDAKVRRWGYTGGDYKSPVRYTSSNFYTRDDNSLEHDFFWVMNDNRTWGTLGSCSAISPTTDSVVDAYGTSTGTSEIRPTLRNDRDFSLWDPGADKGTFGESHVYYWARWYMQWTKGAFSGLGVLPASTSDYEKVLIIVNACEAGAGVHKSAFTVSTLGNAGEGENVILLPERCRSGNANCSSADYTQTSGYQFTYEGNGGYNAPGVIHHELNHFVLRDYFDVGSSLDCAVGTELKYLHEGGLGRTLPQMYWHNKYGIGFDPGDDYLFQSTNPSGEPHVNLSSRNKLSDWGCGPSDKDDPNYVSPYDAGSVVAQPLWEIYHGKEVVGPNLSSMARPATDKGMLKSTYWAVDMVSASTFQGSLGDGQPVYGVLGVLQRRRLDHQGRLVRHLGPPRARRLHRHQLLQLSQGCRGRRPGASASAGRPRLGMVIGGMNVTIVGSTVLMGEMNVTIVGSTVLMGEMNVTIVGSTILTGGANVTIVDSTVLTRGANVTIVGSTVLA